MSTITPPSPPAALAPVVNAYGKTDGPVSALTARGDRKFRPDIQGLRAIAVILVVLYHAGVPGITGGYVGVDVFFVISGFLITRHLISEAASGGVSLSRFYARRIRRLLPLALLVIAVTVIAARVWGPALQATSVAKDGTFASIYVINYWLSFLGTDYQHIGDAASPLQHFWSLAVEEQFYIIWPVIIAIAVLITRKRLRRFRMALLTVAILVIALASFQQSVEVTTSNAPLAYFSLQTRGWELAVGALIAVAIPLFALIPNGIASTMSWAGAALILGSALTFDDNTPFPGSLALVPVIGAALIISSGLVARRGSLEMLLDGRVMQFFGTVSYGWYLWHWPFIVLAPFLFDLDMDWGQKLEMSFLALWFAVLTYLVIERPLARGAIVRKKWFITGSAVTASVLAITVVLTLVAPASLNQRGAVAESLDLQQSTATLGQLISTGVGTITIPANLQPALENAAADVPVTTADGCHLSFTQTVNPDCVYGDTSATRTILLFGDSHAEQWFGAVDALAKAEGWRLVSWTKAACPVAGVELQNDQLKRAYTECTDWRSSIMGRIAILKPDVIIASQADTLAGPSFSNATWGKTTAATVSTLMGLSPSVFFLADTPHPIVDVPGCLAVHAADVATCNVPIYSKSPYDYLTPRRTTVSTDVSALGVPVIDPTNWFCAATSCPSIIADTLVYRDDSHMTQHYSVALEPVLKAALANSDPAFDSK